MLTERSAILKAVAAAFGIPESDERAIACTDAIIEPTFSATNTRQYQKRGDMVDGMLYYAKNHDATDAFERAGGYNSLPWAGKSPWPIFERFVISETSAHGPEIWKKYFIWQRGDGKFVAMSPAKIRQNPQAFMDCWPAFRESCSPTETSTRQRDQEALERFIYG